MAGLPASSALPLSRGALDGMYRGVKAAVLGASGFIGRWVAHRLAAAEAQTFLVVRDPQKSARVFTEYGLRGNVVPADLSSRTAVLEVIEGLQPAILFNLAGYGVDRSERDEAQAQAINADLVEWLCSSKRHLPESAWPGQDLVHVGSALEYGELAGDLAETSPPNPTTLYGRTKLAGTRNLAEGCARSGLRGLTARLFTVYGPGEHTGRLVPALFETSRTQGTLELTAGTQKRDFTYVEDVAEGLLRLGVAQTNPGEIVNLASGRLTSVREFASIAAEILEIAPGQLQFGSLPTRREEMQHDPVAIHRLRTLTGWSPATTIAQGLHKTRRFLEHIPHSSI